MLTSSRTIPIPSAIVMPLLASLSLSSACKNVSILISVLNAIASAVLIVLFSKRGRSSFLVVGKNALGIKSRGVICGVAVALSPSTKSPMEKTTVSPAW